MENELYWMSFPTQIDEFWDTAQQALLRVGSDSVIPISFHSHIRTKKKKKTQNDEFIWKSEWSGSILKKKINTYYYTTLQPTSIGCACKHFRVNPHARYWL